VSINLQKKLYVVEKALKVILKKLY